MGKGSRIISIGSTTDPLREINDDWHYTSFFEIPKYFSTADVNFLKYHVNSNNPDEYVLKLKEFPYDASIRVNLTRMEVLVRQALWEIRTETTWMREVASPSTL